MPLIVCADCQNEISTDATKCPKCGRPTHQPADTSLRSGLKVIGVVLFAIVGVTYCTFRREFAEPQRSTAPIAPQAMSEATDNPLRIHAEAQMNAAARVWKAYENLPPSQKKKDAWIAALAEARSHGVGLTPPFDSIFTKANDAVSRWHMAPLITAETVATGDMNTVLVPSADHVKCTLWASMWSKDAESLRSLGFSKLRCEGTSYVSKLTGLTVQEPAREWTME